MMRLENPLFRRLPQQTHGKTVHTLLSERLRRAMLSGVLSRGARLPSARALAGELGLARGTVVSVYARLESEGYLSARGAAGSYVSESLPARASAARPAHGSEAATVSLSARPAALRPFQVGVPAVDEFPIEAWSRLLARASRRASARDLAYADPLGAPALRRAIASYLAVSRGVLARPEQVVVTAGYQGALGLLCAAYSGPKARAWFEEPGYHLARAALHLAGMRVSSAPVDAQGLDPEAAEATEPRPDLIFTTPSHQMPLGMPLSLARRLQLLAFARRSGALIVEDDYDGEFHYDARPLPALASLAEDAPVIYAGTFSKVMFPALRLGYLVVPDSVRERIRSTAASLAPASNFAVQIAAAEFLSEGHFARHVRRMRRLYAERRAALLDALAKYASSTLVVTPQQGGMHVLARFADGRQPGDVAVVRRANELGLAPLPLSAYYQRPPRHGASGLLLGFAPTAARRFPSEVGLLQRAVRESINSA